MEGIAQQMVERIVQGLEDGSLTVSELTARQLGSYLGRTTGQVYHHFGSLDGLLFAVSQSGFAALGGRLSACVARGGDLGDVAAACVEFCLARPSMYALMFQRNYDWAALRARGLLGPSQPDLSMWNALIAEFAAAGAREPAEDARLFLAGLHGLISMALSGRANVGAIDRSDREVAISSARRLAQLVLPRKSAQSGKRGRNSRPRRKPVRARAARQK
jgi:AcrR family transcriptional regulator